MGAYRDQVLEQQGGLPALAAYELANLISDRRHGSKQVGIRGGNGVRETLDHTKHVVVETEREGEGAVDPGVACRGRFDRP